MIRMKDLGIEYQQASAETLKDKVMDHICASCERDELFRLMGKVNDRITYLDNKEQAFRGLYGRSN